MEHLLHRGLAIGKENVDAFAPDAASAQDCRHPVRDTHERGGGIGGYVPEVRPMLYGHNQHVAWIHRLKVQKGSDLIVTVNETARCVAGKDLTEDTSRHVQYTLVVVWLHGKADIESTVLSRRHYNALCTPASGATHVLAPANTRILGCLRRQIGRPHEG
jgi:hypothetical protein